jgi:hypothetical protein
VIEASPHMLSLGQIRSRVNRLALRIEAPQQILPTYGRSADFGRPHIESDRAYHFVVVERGQELERRTTWDLDQLLYWIFAGITFELACQFELENRIPTADFRRALFRKQLDLLGELDHKWRTRRKVEILSILSAHPFSDGGPTDLDWAN